MTLDSFSKRLKKLDSRLHIKARGYGDIAGVYKGNEYLFRISKGEFNLNGYRYKYFHSDMSTTYGVIAKRGRKTLVRMLENKGYIKTNAQRASLLWGYA